MKNFSFHLIIDHPIIGRVLWTYSLCSKRRCPIQNIHPFTPFFLFFLGVEFCFDSHFFFSIMIIHTKPYWNRTQTECPPIDTSYKQENLLSQVVFFVRKTNFQFLKIKLMHNFWRKYRASGVFSTNNRMTFSFAIHTIDIKTPFGSLNLGKKEKWY